MNNGSGSEGSKAWNMYTTSPEPTPSQRAQIDREPPWKSTSSSSYGTSMNAISFGFVATAILISMFLIMAIFEHLFRPNPSFASPEQVSSSSLESGHVHKLGNPQRVSSSYGSGFSVVMPGQQCPTFIAQPAPLPRPRESVYWPPHEHSFVYS